MSQPASIDTVIFYNTDNGKRQVASLNPNIKASGDGAIETSVSITVNVKNARLRSPAPTLETVGYCLARQTTSLTRKEQFLDDELVKNVYYEELSALICAVTGATHCKPFHHMVRTADPSKNKNNPKTEGPAGAAHVDYSKNNSVNIYDGSCPREYLNKGKFCVINAWRNIDPVNPIMNDHLAMLDANSLTAPDDFIPLDLINKDGSVSETYRLEPSRAHLHRWNYFPAMTKDEVLIFMQYNSDPTSPARFTFHSSINDSSAPKTTSAGLPLYRESIELRTIAFFPTFHLQTIPRTITNGATMIDRGVRKLIELVSYLPQWDENGRAWVRSIVFSGDDLKAGIETIARHLANEHVRKNLRESADATASSSSSAGDGGGMKEETFEAIIKKTLDDGEFQRILQLHVKPYTEADRVEEAVKNLTNNVAPKNVAEHWKDKSWAQSLIKTFGLDAGVRQIAQALVKYSCESQTSGLNAKTPPNVNNDVVQKLIASPTFKEHCRLSFS